MISFSRSFLKIRKKKTNLHEVAIPFFLDPVEPLVVPDDVFSLEVVEDVLSFEVAEVLLPLVLGDLALVGLALLEFVVVLFVLPELV